MKFLKLELEDIFVYRGKSEIDLSLCTPQQNIVVIQGRNGHGKTSLLNAIKLLFLGPEDDRIRRVGVGETSIGPKQYVVGQTGRWYGVFNLHARDEDLPARVALSWIDDDQACRAERIFWPLRGGTDFRQQLNVTRGRETLDEADAQAFLQSLLPKEVVPFFFFDGEQIQSLADAEIGREQGEIERLLGLSFTAHILREIEAYSRERRKAGLPEAIQAEITAAEGAQKTAEARAEAAERERLTLEEEIADLDRDKKAIEQERNRLRGGLSEEERRRMVGRIDVIKTQRETVGNRIAMEIPVEAFALANLNLAKRAFDMLEEQLAGAADATLATRLHQTLPDAVIEALAALEPPIDLEASRSGMLRRRVGAALEKAGVSRAGHDNPLLASLSPRKVKSLRDRFLLWTEAGDVAAGAQADLLRQARQLAHDEKQLREELDNAEITSEDARRRYASLTLDFESLEATIRSKIAEMEGHAIAEREARREAATQADLVKKRYAEQEHVTRENEAFNMSRKAKSALEYYRDERRKLIRASVERSLDTRAQLLLGPSQLVKQVRLDDNFSISYFDERGDAIGRHSLSAGMRQLAAMAMLWALKDEARRPLPVIIDTPLGRIDRENRALLVAEYFPNAGMPLVILPTNTELGDEDIARLMPHIAKRYEIQNDGGTSSRIVEIPLGSGKGASHG